MNLLDSVFNFKDFDSVCGLTDELSCLYFLDYFKKHNDNVLVLVNSLYEANRIHQRLLTYTDDVCIFAMDDFLASVALAISPELKVERLNTLEKLKNNDKKIVVTNLMGYLKYLPCINESENTILNVEKGSVINRDLFVEKLENFGYKRESVVTTTGEYALRGFIIDIFPIEAEHPIRIELFGDEIDSIRVFNEGTQLSINELTKYNILPFDEIISDNKSSLFEYMDNPFTFIINESQIMSSYDKLLEDMDNYAKSKDINNDFMFSYDDIKLNRFIKIETINNLANATNYNSKETIKFKGDLDELRKYCESKIPDKTIIFCLSKEKQIEDITNLFDKVNVGSIINGNINIINYRINEGFEINNNIFISEYDISSDKLFTKYHSTFKIGRKIKDFNDLKVGDYVVHTQHGIGIYGGITAINRGNMIRDYIQINYLDNDKIFVPVEKITTIYKFADADGTPPKLNKLNSPNWAKTKMQVKSKIHDITGELIKLYAQRESITGPIFKDFADQDVFNNQFEFSATSDQLRCSTDINKDLSNKVPMDRLLCGDVGFGKTEVAFRGMFKTVINGYQVAYLCPTTLLSRQQYLNALDRFKEFPINIALLNRFTKPSEVKRIINGLKEGSIDIVFGTHKLLNKDITYKNLGLLVIDEEQRFGVTHKEKIKEIKNDVNVLTLSATPIPRTLKMAMSGLRDLSIIDTAPINRYPVQTYVLESNDLIIKDAIYKEMSRNGQVFILYNRVETIMDEYTRIKSLVPEARIAIAHGKMDKDELEDVVSSFIDYEYDVLICTTIIETGIDIPNVNTLIILEADRFGLSQLYQLRGRVGRSDKIAYAYLMYEKSKILGDTATKRLQAIKEFTELGSGYKIAMRDLAIRGAGDLLGSEQAGFVDSVGIELYTQMVNDEIKRLKGEAVIDEEPSNPLIEVENHISDEYVSEGSLKIEIHKMINEVKDQESLDDIKGQIEDRFGTVSDEIDIYMHEEWFEKLASSLNITNVKQTDDFIDIELPDDLSNKIDGEKLFLITYNINPKYKLSYFLKRIHIKLPLVGLEKHFIYYEVKLLDEILNMTKEK